MSASHVLAIDLGGTSLRAATAPRDDPTAIAQLGQWPAPASLAEFRNLLADVRAGIDARLAGIGVTAPGLVEGTTCRWIPNLPYLDGVDLRTLFEPTDVPLAAGNDAQLALLAEARLGTARGRRNAILLAIGTGIGSAVLADGHIVRGAHGGACSFGWACADPSDPGDDRLGWLERQASGRALDAAGRGLHSPGGGVALIAAARAGDARSLAVIDHVGGLIGTTLAGAVALLDPEIVLLAGGLSESADVLQRPILASLARQLPPHLRGIELAPGAFGPKAGLVGAAVAATRGEEWWRIG